MDDILAARRSQEILTLAERDIAEVWKHYLPGADTTQVPIIAVDWSEVRSYATGEAPFAAAVPPLWRLTLPSLHYSALVFLLFRLPCRLLLLPPYLEEMRNYLDRLRYRARSAIAEVKAMPVESIRRQLAVRLRSLLRDTPQLRQVLDGTDIVEPLNNTLRELVRETIEQYLPRVFLELQVSTLRPLEAISDLLRRSHDGERRIVTLADLDSSYGNWSAKAVRNWEYWYNAMILERPKALLANQIDAVAMSLLEVLHCGYFWHNQRRLYFASRSPAMSRVMGRHPGTFPAFSSISADDLDYDLSSGRPWEYFAEIGYHMANGFRKADLDRLSLRRLFLSMKASELQAADAQALGTDDRPFSDEVKAAVLRWERVRGSFDLQGMGNLANWETLQSREDKLLIKFLRLILSGTRVSRLFEQAEDIANQAHAHVINVFGMLSLRDDSRELRSRVRDIRPPNFPSTSLFGSSHTVLDLPYIVRGGLHRDAAAQVTRLFSLVRERSDEAKNVAETILTENAQSNNPGQKLQKLWSTGFALFCLHQHDRAPYHFTSWLAANEATVAPLLLLATVSLIAESYRYQHRDNDAMDIIDKCRSQKERFTRKESLVWLNLQAALVSRIIESRGEERGEFSHEPEKCAMALLDEMEDKQVIRVLPREPTLKAWSINNFLYLFSRCIQANRDSEVSRRVKENLAQAERYALELEKLSQEYEEARYLHTLGYYYMKRYLYKFFGGEDDPKIFDKAERWFTRGLRVARSGGDDEIEELIRKHQRLAQDYVTEGLSG